MTQAANNYGQVLYERKVPAQMVEDARKAFEEVPQLKQVLASPVIPKSKKTSGDRSDFSPGAEKFFQSACGPR